MDFLKGILNNKTEANEGAGANRSDSIINNVTGEVGDIFKGGLNFITGGISGMILWG